MCIDKLMFSNERNNRCMWNRVWNWILNHIIRWYLKKSCHFIILWILILSNIILKFFQGKKIVITIRYHKRLIIRNVNNCIFNKEKYNYLQTDNSYWCTRRKKQTGWNRYQILWYNKRCKIVYYFSTLEKNLL